jgi:hypothetical protein
MNEGTRSGKSTILYLLLYFFCLCQCDLSADSKVSTLCVSKFNAHWTVHCICIIKHNQQDATIFFIVVSALHVSSGFSAHHQELGVQTHPRQR